jgi:uncharacterized protein YeaO (DUF488 family)
MVIAIRRIYSMKDHPTSRKETDSFNIFVDRLWARGIKKGEVKMDLWLKEIAPSNKLRKWFAHDPDKWKEFKNRYFKELDSKKELVEPILQKLHSGVSISLLYGAKDEEFNNAVALREYLLQKLTN